MPKISDCDRCRFYTHDYHLVCTLHPDGPDGDTCLDFDADPEEVKSRIFVDFLGLQRQANLEPDEELWEPKGVSFYNGELILQLKPSWTPEQQLELLNKHPMFTGTCPACGAVFERDYRALVHWDCSDCGWKDDSI